MKRYRSAEEQVRIYLFTYLFIYLFIYFWWSIFRRSDQNCRGKKKVLPRHFVYVPEVFSSVKTNKFRRETNRFKLNEFLHFLKIFFWRISFFSWFFLFFYSFMRKSEWKKKFSRFLFWSENVFFLFWKAQTFVFCDTHFTQQAEIHHFLAAKSSLCFFPKPQRETQTTIWFARKILRLPSCKSRNGQYDANV